MPSPRNQSVRKPSLDSSRSIDGSPKNRNWHQLEIAKAFDLLTTSETGLTADEARRRLSGYGPNTLDFKVRRGPVRIMLGQFTDFMIVVLIAAAILSGIIGDIQDTIVIAAIVVLNGIIGFVQEYRAERAIQALKKMAAPIANVMRNHRIASIPAGEIVPGDILVLDAGAIVSADLRLIESAQLQMDEAALTGESHPVEKTIMPLSDGDLPVADRSNMAYAGTFVRHGRGRGVVIATGIETEFGQIATMLHATEATETPLQRRLAQFGKQLAVVALVVAAFIFLLGVLRGEAFVLMLLTAVSLAVAAIPEALPAVVTISLALGARRMVQKQALVRKLAAVEALGSVTVICSDKTGTLTQNRMSVQRFHCGGGSVDVPQSDGVWKQLLLAMALSNDVRQDADSSPLGDPTEVALFNAAQQAGVDKRIIEHRYRRVAELPFDSDRKCMTTLHLDPSGGLIAFTKGATESLAARAVDGITVSGTQAVRLDELFNAADEMAAVGLRVLAFGMRRWSAQPVDLSPETVERNLTIIGLVGIGDPIRREAVEAIEMCRRAGVVTTMITGDHPVTAKAVAKELGILEEEATWTGRDLTQATEEELAAQVDSIRVYARVAPEQKLKIVRALQARGHLVAMTGDGVNDAPALKQAEIGVAMGITGTDVARQASSLILLDDNFATIVGAVKEGRKIYDNLRRFVRYAVTTNSSEILTMLIAPLLGLPIPLLPLQILWVNLVTDGLPGLALAMEPEERYVMDRPPRPPRETIFARGLGIHVVWVGALMSALAVATQFVTVKFGFAAWQTIVLSVVVFSQLAHVMAIRSETDSLFKQGLLSNKPLLGSVLLMVILQLAVIYTPILNGLFSTRPLGSVELAWTILAGSIIFLAVEVEKWIRRKTTINR